MGVASLITPDRPAPAETRPATGGITLPGATFRSCRSRSPSREESNDGTHKTKAPELQRRRMGPEPGPGVSGSQDRHFPDRVARERAKDHEVAGARRLGEGEATFDVAVWQGEAPPPLDPLGLRAGAGMHRISAKCTCRCEDIMRDRRRRLQRNPVHGGSVGWWTPVSVISRFAAHERTTPVCRGHKQ